MATSVLQINSFGARADDGSHTLGNTADGGYASLAAYQAAWDALIVANGMPSGSVPDPVTTWVVDPATNWGSIEQDWSAWQGAENFAYYRDDLKDNKTTNGGHGHFIADGRYQINRTVTMALFGARIEGQISTHRFDRGSQTVVSYNGPTGTLDVPIYMFDFYGATELGANPPNRKPILDSNSGGVRPRMNNLTLRGKNITSDDPSGWSYVSGVRVRKASYAHFDWMTFGNDLWDALRFTDAQLFPIVDYNNFYGVVRDGIAFDGVKGNFSTTMTLHKNEFGAVGRYSMYVDCKGSVEAAPVILDNDFEGTSHNYLTAHPEWFVQGVKAPVCIVHSGNLTWDANRFEGIGGANWHGCLHLVACTSAYLRGGTTHNVVATATPSGTETTKALTDYRDTYGHQDITDTRNYDLALGGGGNELLRIDSLYNMSGLWTVGSVSTSNIHEFDNVKFAYFAMPTKDGAGLMDVHGDGTLLVPNKMVQAPDVGIPTLLTTPNNFSMRNTWLIAKDRSARYSLFDTSTNLGAYSVKGGSGTYGVWAPNTVMAVPYRTNTDTWGSFRVPTSTHENGRVYQAIAVTGDGKTGATEPTWPAAANATVQDNNVTWKNVGVAYPSADNGVAEWVEAGLLRRAGTVVAPATVPSWPGAKGAIFYNTAPVAGKPAYWVATGTGTWLPGPNL